MIGVSEGNPGKSQWSGSPEHPTAFVSNSQYWWSYYYCFKKESNDVMYKGNIFCCDSADFNFTRLFLWESISFLLSIASKIASMHGV